MCQTGIDDEFLEEISRRFLEEILEEFPEEISRSPEEEDSSAEKPNSRMGSLSGGCSDQINP